MEENPWAMQQSEGSEKGEKDATENPEFSALMENKAGKSSQNSFQCYIFVQKWNKSKSRKKNLWSDLVLVYEISVLMFVQEQMERQI